MILKYIYIDSNSVDRIHFLQILKQFPRINLMAEFSDAIRAKEYLNYNSVDFAIVSSNLNIYNGFEFVEQLKDDIEIIFLTKTSVDAVKSYERGFLDCLLKPVTQTRLKTSIDRLINKLECLQLIQEKKEHVVHLKCNFKSEKLQANSIRWIEAMGDYVKVVTKNKNSGFYHLLQFKGEGEVINDLEVEFRRDEKVMRFLTVKLDTHAQAWAEKRRKKNKSKVKA